MFAFLLAALLAQAAATPASEPGDAVITQSSSTNSAGYTIVVHPDFTAEIRRNAGTSTATVGAAQAKWLFERLRAARPLDAAGARGCMKSASFGTATTIAYGGVTTADLSCGRDPTSLELARTASVIAAQLGVAGLRVRPRMLVSPLP